MLLDYSGELERLFGVLERGWTLLNPSIPIAKPWGEPLDLNQKCKGPGGELLPYLRFATKTIQPQRLTHGSLGDDAHAHPGVLLLDVFVAPRDGQPLATVLAQQVIGLFNNYNDGILHCAPGYATWVGLASNGWCQMAVTIAYTRIERH